MKKFPKLLVTLGAVTAIPSQGFAQHSINVDKTHINSPAHLETLSSESNQSLTQYQLKINDPINQNKNDSETVPHNEGRQSAVNDKAKADISSKQSPVKVFDAEGRAYSQIGIERNLPLYDTDKADFCVDQALQIRITVHNVTREGILKLELFGEKNFMKSKGKLRRIRVPAEADTQKVCINLPSTGQYAVVGYHDVNGDRKLKKAWNFKPLEPYGLSNNPVIKSLRLPRFSETGFDVPLNGVDIDINLVGPDD